MPSMQEAMQKAAAQQGMTVNVPLEPTAVSTPKAFGRRLVRQIEKIKLDKNPKFNRKATAPYNFVPLNEKVITVGRFESFDMYDMKNRKTGYIECEIEALTLLYIRDALTENEYHAGKASADFFSPAGSPRLPGSSLRGLARNLVEILSWSKLATELKRIFYYRGLADQSNLRKEYQSHMSSFNAKAKSAIYKMNAGYLEKAGATYRIIPARKINNRQFEQILKTETADELAKTPKSEVYAFKIYQTETAEQAAKTPEAEQPRSPKECYYFRSGSNCIVVSGFMPNKKRDWLIYPPDEKTGEISILETDVRNYLLDENRNGPNLIEELKIAQGRIPCFYVQWVDREKQKRVSFGHTAMFRLAYEQALGDLLPDDHVPKSKEAALLDMAECIFGTISEKQIVASRVYFEDAVYVAAPASSKTENAIPQILSSPKPTTFQHYLVQTSDFIRELNHYNSATFLRGHKLYWHRATDWRAKDLTLDAASCNQFLNQRGLVIPNEHKEEKENKIIIKNFPSLKDAKLKTALFEYVANKENSQYTVIKPILTGTKFRAKIRFENLTAVELGALLSALQLPESCCHKIGMGKPLGLGSIKITPKLFLSDRGKRYSALGAEWTTASAAETEETLHALKAEFENFILQQLDAAEKPASNNLWDTYRLKQLRVMLDWRNTSKNNWQEKTRYLEIEHEHNGNEYKNRPVLPIPEYV